MKKRCIQFAVIKFTGGWRILAEGRQLAELYKYSVDAEDAALDLASQAKIAGWTPEILVQQPYGELRRLLV